MVTGQQEIEAKITEEEKENDGSEVRDERVKLTLRWSLRILDQDQGDAPGEGWRTF